VINLKKKILVWLDDEITRFGVAKSLHDKKNFELYGLIDVSKKSKNFYEKQIFVDFKKKWFLHDEIEINKNVDLDYLKKFENEYELRIWDLINNERLFNKYNLLHNFSYHETLKIFESECKLFEKILIDNKPDYVFLQLPWHHHILLFVLLCEKLKIPTIFIRWNINDPSQSFISEHWESLPEDLENISVNTIKENTSPKNPNYNSYLKKKSTQLLSSRKKFAQGAISYMFSRDVNERNNYRYFGYSKFKLLKIIFLDKMKTNLRKKFIDKYLSKNPNLENKYIYFSLSINQEQAISTLAPFYDDQIALVENLAKCIPVNYKLIVKEHPYQKFRSWRPTDEYKTIMNLPNVELIHPDFSSKTLIQKSDLVISISGTTPFEAGNLKKPSIMFTNRFFSYLPFITVVTSIHELTNKITEILSTEYDFSDINKITNYFDKVSFPVDYHALHAKAQDLFQFGGFLVNSNIDSKKMRSFLIDNQTEFSIIADEIEKKILEI